MQLSTLMDKASIGAVRTPNMGSREDIMSIKACHVIALVALTIVLQSTAWGDGLPKAKPKDVGLSQERLDRITAAMEEDVEKGELRGAILTDRSG